MRCRIVLILAAVALTAAAPTALAQSGSEGQPPVRPARTPDLPGMWQMVGLTKAQGIDADDSLFAPFQIFFFDRNGRMKHMTSTKPFTSLALFEAAPMVTSYSVDKRGMLILSNPSWDAPRRYPCSVVTKTAAGDDPKQPRAGDILLTGLDDAGKVAWSKLLRKTPSTER